MKNMISHFVILGIREKNQGTHLGLLWTALEPTLVFILLYTVFTSIKFRGGEDYPIYLLTSIIIYHIFTRGTLRGLTSLRSNKSIIKSIYIRKEFFPVVATATTCLLVFIQIGVFFALMPFFNFIPSSTIIFLPIVVGLLLVLTLGLSYILSIIHVFAKDIQYIWGILVHMLFFLTPVLWYLEDANDFLLSIHRFNPVGLILELGHNIVVFRQVPPIDEWLYAATFSFAILFVGYVIFQKYQSRVAEIL